jgi:hypothetical protein
MRSVSLRLAVLTTALFVPRPAWAQDSKIETTIGYAFLRDRQSRLNLPAGWAAAASWTIRGRFGAVAEGGGNDRSLMANGVDGTLRMHWFSGGTRWVFRPQASVRLFVQVQVGTERGRLRLPGLADLTLSHFMWQPGGGVDIALNRTIALRLEGDVRQSFTDGAGADRWLVVTGVTIRLK